MFFLKSLYTCKASRTSCQASQSRESLPDPTTSLDNIQVLSQLLLSQPDANNDTGVRPGDLVLGLWLAGFEFDRSDSYKGVLAFYMDYESGMDAESYRWSKEGFDKIMCLIGGFKRAFVFE